MESQDGISRDRRVGRRLTGSRPGFEAEALEAVMRQALRNGTTAVHEYRAWPAEDPRREHAFSASYFCLQDADGKTLGLCGISVDVTSSQRARERLAILSNPVAPWKTCAPEPRRPSRARHHPTTSPCSWHGRSHSAPPRSPPGRCRTTRPLSPAPGTWRPAC
ncbi:PAS domain-containing protein [Streptomyces sp. NPDC056704]|uniref:PAS domain-containing protein n=1 Tax=Streptomyces sp. NPDC056704 TaxID=3345917 RepID=UPI0036AA5871